MNDDITQLKKQVVDLQAQLKQFMSANSLALEIDQALTGRGFIKMNILTKKSGILSASKNVLVTLSGATGTFVDKNTNTIHVSNGIITSLT